MPPPGGAGLDRPSGEMMKDRWSAAVQRGLVWGLGAVCGAAWLLPYHHHPWAAFYTDAWVSIGLLGLLWVRIATSAAAWPPASAVSGLLLGLCCIPVLQWLAGLVYLPSDAWISCAYLLGFALAVFAGEAWVQRRTSPEIAALLVLGIGVAGLLSVALQISQWTRMIYGSTALAAMVMELPSGMRPYGNLGQPNQLATLQLWSILALLWAWRHGLLGRNLALAGSAVVVFGLALTQSRTAWLSFFVLAILACLWRKRDFGRQLALSALSLYLLYLVCLALQPWVANVLGVSFSSNMADRLRLSLGDDLRWQAWQMFLDASLVQPWTGYGWGQTRQAMFSIAPAHPGLAGVPFAHAHMLPLDLILWVGWPAGLLIISLAVYWVMRMARNLKAAEDALVFAALLVVGIHAMLELPLHYAYFLLPTGVFIGYLNARNPSVVRWVAIRKGWIVALAFCATGLLGVIIRDYLHVERSFMQLHFAGQQARTPFARIPPDTWLLHHWHDFIVMAMTEPSTGMTDGQLEHWRALVMHYPAPSSTHKYMQALELNGKREDIAYFRDRFCAIMPLDTCRLMSQRWAAAAGAAPGPSPASAARSEPAGEPLPTPESARLAGSVSR